MTRRKDDNAAREDAFLGELIPQITEHLAERHAGDFDAVGGQARFMTWLAAHTSEPAKPRYVRPVSLTLARLVFAGVAGLSGPCIEILFLIRAVHGWAVAPSVFAGLVGGLVLFLVAFYRGLWKEPELLSPQEYQIEQIKAHPVGVGEFPPDLAWPFYTFRQASIDRRVVRRYLSDQYRRMWRWPSDTFYRGLHGSRLWWWTLLLPITVTVISFLLLAGLSAWFCYGVYWLVMTACMTVNGAAFGLIMSYLRTAEARRRGRRHTQAACMNCFHVTPWPAYLCPGCSALHHDVRPSRLGLFTRRCECGTRFPTMASRAAWHMTALCKRTSCRQPLAEGAGAVRDIRIPVFGDTSVGKTRFLYASLNSLLLSARQARIPVSFPDQSSRDQADLGLDLIRSGQDTTKTSATIPVALTVRLREGRRSDLVHLFDAAGEHFRDAQRYDTLRFLDHSQGLVYVLDPFSIGPIRDQLAGHNAAVIRQAHAAVGDPEIAYGEVMSRLRDSGVPAASQRLAVVISKADLLRGIGMALPSSSDAIAEWLKDIGLHNLVMSARREFAEVRYFTVASQQVVADRANDPGVPLRWLLTVHGVRLPADTVAHRGSRRSQTTSVPSESSKR
jgi:Double-GTPase 2